MEEPILPHFHGHYLEHFASPSSLTWLIPGSAHQVSPPPRIHSIGEQIQVVPGILLGLVIIARTALIPVSPQTIPGHVHYSICHPGAFIIACDTSVSSTRRSLLGKGFHLGCGVPRMVADTESALNNVC